MVDFIPAQIFKFRKGLVYKPHIKCAIVDLIKHGGGIIKSEISINLKILGLGTDHALQISLDQILDKYRL